VPEAHLRQSALAHLGLAARTVATIGDAGIGVTVVGPVRQLALRGESADADFLAAAEAALGTAPPTQPNTASSAGDLTVLWLGPSEWLLVGDVDPARLDSALAGTHHAMVDVTESRTVLRLSGPRVRDLLAKGCSLDLHQRVFAVGACAQSTLALTEMLLHRLPDPAEGPAFDVYVHRSSAGYLWQWLEVAAAEYGLAVLET
jgi:sarcosine oxidase, subunit gamma